GARYLEPRFSKWISTDPALGDYLAGKTAGGLSAPVNFSPYVYGRNSPVVYVDADGHIAYLAVVAGGAAIGFVAGAGLYYAREYYVHRSFEHATLGGALEAGGQGAATGVALTIAPVAATVALTTKAVVDLAPRVVNYQDASVEEQRGTQFDVATTVLTAAVGVRIAAGRTTPRPSTTPPKLLPPPRPPELPPYVEGQGTQGVLRLNEGGPDIPLQSGVEPAGGLTTPARTH